MKTLIFVIVLVGCAGVPHVDPLPRDEMTQTRAHVRIEYACGGTGHWSRSGDASGVIISERHVLTAAHAVSCPEIPRTRVTLFDGRSFTMVVERDDLMFGSGRDIARLGIWGLEHFEVGVAPPSLVDPERLIRRTVCGPEFCGLAYYDGRFITAWFQSFPGDSGSGVYTLNGGLAGIIKSAGHSEHRGYYTVVEPVSEYWLEGT